MTDAKASDGTAELRRSKARKGPRCQVGTCVLHESDLEVMVFFALVRALDIPMSLRETRGQQHRRPAAPGSAGRPASVTVCSNGRKAVLITPTAP